MKPRCTPPSLFDRFPPILSMGHSDETALLIVHHNSLKNVRKSPFHLVPPHIRPYLELIRLEKVCSSCRIMRCVAHLSQPTGTILMFWPFGELSKVFEWYSSHIKHYSMGFDNGCVRYRSAITTLLWPSHGVLYQRFPSAQLSMYCQRHLR